MEIGRFKQFSTKVGSVYLEVGTHPRSYARQRIFRLETDSTGGPHGRGMPSVVVFREEEELRAVFELLKEYFAD
jgi:formylmethanofuran dehydrogenase subunit D